jgi:6-phosphogluconolactonase
MATIQIAKDGAALSEALAKHIVRYIKEVLETQDRFTFVLSGGSTPKALYQLLASDTYRNLVDWSKVHFFWGDERAVPYEDDRNNAKMADETLLQYLPTPANQIHRMRTDIPAEASAAHYEDILHTYFDGKEHTFDLVLLGMGDDGHTLSLFPGQPVVHEQQYWATAFYLQAQEMYRITLTAPVTNLSKQVVFLTTGTGKAAALKEVLEGELNIPLYPSQIIRPPKGDLIWFVDEAAASKLSKS